MRKGTVSRRTTLSIVGIASVSGCLDVVPFSSSRPTDVSLGSIFVQDHREEETTYQLELTREDEVVLREEIVVGDEYEVVHPTWSTDPAEYTLRWASDETEKTTSIPEDVEEDLDGAECYHPHIRRLLHYDGPVIEVFPYGDADEGRC